MRLDSMKHNRKRAPHSLLSEAQAQQILDAETEPEAILLGKQFKVQRQTVLKIRKRTSWKHLVPSKKSIAERVIESINWISISDQLPDAGSEVLVCFERNDCFDREVTIANYDDSAESTWWVDGGLTQFGVVLFWAEIPAGPQR